MGREVTGASTLPDSPPPHTLRALGIEADETRVIGVDEVWWRVHRTAGSFVLGWNAFRTYGPVLRFDPHVLPQGDDPNQGVWYGGSTPDVALGEAFQVNRTLDRELNSPYLTGLSFMRPLTVLDLAADSAGAWATRVGGTFAISTAPHAGAQQWARNIVAAFPNLHGLRYNSRFAGGPSLALFHPSLTAMPGRPKLSLPLNHPDLVSRIASAAKRLGYSVI
jgi:RES domain